MFWWSSRSPEEEALRIIREQKFYATLPKKLDNAIEEWHEEQPPEEELWETKEVGTFGQDGWSISSTYKPRKADD